MERASVGVIKVLDLSYNLNVIQLVMNGRKILITQEVLIEILILPQTSDATRIPGHAVEKMNGALKSCTSHEKTHRTKEGWSVTKFAPTYIPRIFAIW